MAPNPYPVTSPAGDESSAGHAVSALIGLAFTGCSLWLGLPLLAENLWLAAQPAADVLPARTFAALGSAALFALGLGISVGGAVLARQAHVERKLRAAHPEAPWRWRLAWSGPQLAAEGSRARPAEWIIAAWMLLMALPPSLTMVAGGVSFDPLSLAGTVLLWITGFAALAVVWRRRRNAQWRRGFVLRPDRLPLRRGVVLRGLAQAPAAAAGPGLELRVLCERFQPRAPNQAEGKHEMLWETVLSHPAHRPGLPLQWSVRLPAHLPDSGATVDGRRHAWWLELRAGQQSPTARFSLPVFGADADAPSPAARRTRAAAPGMRTDLMPAEIAQALQRQRLDITWEGDRLTRVASASGRHRRGLAILGVSALVLLLPALLALLSGVWLLALGFGGMAALLVVLMKGVVAQQRSVTLSAGRIHFEVGQGRQRRVWSWAPASLVGVDVQPSMILMGKRYYNVVARNSDGNSETIVAHVEGLHLCEALADAVQRWRRAGSERS